MSSTAQISERIAALVRRRNNELASQAALKAGFGAVFFLFMFGMIFAAAWILGSFFCLPFLLFLGWQFEWIWQFACIVTGLFVVVATLSAWWRVDPMAGLKPLTNRQLALMLLSQASPGILYFSPRHASAGLALLLLGGPSNIFEAIGIWFSRIRADGSLLMEAAALLAACEKEYPADQIRDPAAAVLLLQLALTKILPRDDSAVWTVTDKGHKVLMGGKRGTAKPTEIDGTPNSKRRSKKGSADE